VNASEAAFALAGGGRTLAVTFIFDEDPLLLPCGRSVRNIPVFFSGLGVLDVLVGRVAIWFRTAPVSCSMSYCDVLFILGSSEAELLLTGGGLVGSDGGLARSG